MPGMGNVVAVPVAPVHGNLCMGGVGVLEDWIAEVDGR